MSFDIVSRSSFTRQRSLDVMNVYFSFSFHATNKESSSASNDTNANCKLSTFAREMASGMSVDDRVKRDGPRW